MPNPACQSRSGISIDVVIPAYNATNYLHFCLKALLGAAETPNRIIVVDDGSTDDTREIAASYPVVVIRTDGRRGPAFARNLGASEATGDVVLFVDADVCVRHDTLARLYACFDADPELDAVIGAYDTEPQSPDFLSQYRNLMHSFVHQSATGRACTFWSGCGAIRRELFLEHSGFDERFGRPAIEDIELGYRLHRAGRKLMLDGAIQVTHLKRWTFWNLVKTDIMDRGSPWTELILRDRFMPNDLNLQLSQRVSVALVFLLVAFSTVAAAYAGGYFLLPLFFILFILLARWWGEMAAPERPASSSATLFAGVGIISVLAWRHHMFGLIPPLLLSPALLLIQHRYATRGSKPPILRWTALLYSAASIVIAIAYFPAHMIIYPTFFLVAILAWLNSAFYIFLAEKRGIPFLLAAIPFHLLYHFYNGVSFAIGLTRHTWSGVMNTERETEFR